MHLQVKGIQVSLNEGPCAFPKGDKLRNSENKLTKFLKIFFSRTPEPISTKLCTKHPWVRKIQVCSSEGPYHFLRGDNYEIAKIH